MMPERYKQVDELFTAALERQPEERAAFLDQACSGDSDLRREVEALLSADEQAQSFIESPAYQLAPELLTDDPPRSLVGQTIGPHRMIKQLGSGGMGQVYLAEDLRLGRRIALKLLSDSLTGDSLSRKRFVREARVASALDHPNICTIYEVGEARGWCFIAMQYVEGQTLREVIRGRPLSLDSMLSLSLQTADALAAAHSQGIVHRDIKSGNIIVTERGQAKVLDFGLAKSFGREAGMAGDELSRTGAVHGTPAYMSPEQARGERADYCSDIFSLGVVTYEMATGRLPFKGESQAEMMNAVINQAHTPVSELNKEVPPELSTVLNRALAKDPVERYQSVAELIADLRKVMAQTGSLSHSLNSSETPRGAIVPYVPLRRGRFWGRLRRTGQSLPLALAVACVMLIGLALMVYNHWVKPSEEPVDSRLNSSVGPVPIRAIAVLPFKPVVEASRDEILEMGMADTLITRLSSIRRVNVRPMSAVRKYAGLEQDAIAAGREQRVDAVLDGSIQKSGEKIRVTVRLVSIADGAALWTGQFDERFTDIFSVQDAISEKVAGALAMQLTGQERELLAKRYTGSAPAYLAYSHGRYFWSKRTYDGLQRAIECFNQAIAIDPHYALAYAGLADTYNTLGALGFLPQKEASPKASEMATKALELDDTLAEAHGSLAAALADYYWNWPEAEKHFQRAIALNPSYAYVHEMYAEYLSYVGRHEEAIAEAERAQTLDPTSSPSVARLGMSYNFAGQYDCALEHFRTALDLDPNFHLTHFGIGQVYRRQGRYEEALAEMRQARALGMKDALPIMGLIYAVSGRRREAQQVLDELNELSKREHVPAFNRAVVYVGLGDKERAFEWLEKAYADREWYLWLLKEGGAFERLQSDPRFTDLLRRIGLER
jgi:serine/threonine-protein kinase